jgi:hypothetical protein
MALLIGEGHLADRFDAVTNGFALGHVNGAEHAHLQVNSGISHGFDYWLNAPHFAGGGFLFTAATLPEPKRQAGLPYRVVAGDKLVTGKIWPP